jgi:hypothetical protein
VTRSRGKPEGAPGFCALAADRYSPRRTAPWWAVCAVHSLREWGDALAPVTPAVIKVGEAVRIRCSPRAASAAGRRPGRGIRLQILPSLGRSYVRDALDSQSPVSRAREGDEVGNVMAIGLFECIEIRVTGNTICLQVSLRAPGKAFGTKLGYD